VLRSAGFWVAVAASLAAGYAVRAAVEIWTDVNAQSLVPHTRLEELTAGDCSNPVDANADVIRIAKKVLEDDRSGFEDIEFSRTDRPCVLEFSIPHESFYQGLVAIRSDGSTVRLDFFSRLDASLNATERATFSVWILPGEYAFENIHSRLFKISRPDEVRLLK
jgi:hypothetical protein